MIMANKRGPRQTGRKLLTTIAASILSYAAPIWVEATLSYAKQSACFRRFCALRVCSAYRTVSDDASLVIASLYPVVLLAMEARDICNLIIEGTKLGPCAGKIQSSFDNFAGVIVYQTLSNGLIESTERSTFI